MRGAAFWPATMGTEVRNGPSQVRFCSADCAANDPHHRTNAPQPLPWFHRPSFSVCFFSPQGHFKMSIHDRLKALDITLPPASTPAAAYLP